MRKLSQHVATGNDLSSTDLSLRDLVLENVNISTSTDDTVLLIPSQQVNEAKLSGVLPRYYGSVSALDGLSGAEIDSRKITQGMIFFALKGEHVDGHAYCVAAANNGASLVVIDDLSVIDEVLSLDGFANGRLGLVVTDSVQTTMHRWASAWRQRIDPLVIGLTGSVGKTTTKEIMTCIAEAAIGQVAKQSTDQAGDLTKKTSVWSTPGNWNNHFGVPLTVLNMPATTQIAIVEMGMNHSGEIRSLCEISAPDVGVITAVAAAHTAFFDSIDDIAAAKAEIWEKIPDRGGYVYADQAEGLLAPYLSTVPAHRRTCCRRVSDVSELSAHAASVYIHTVSESGIDVSIRLPRTFPSSPGENEAGMAYRWRGKVPVLGGHFSSNLLVAIAALVSGGLEIDAAVLDSVDWSRVTESDRRMTYRSGADGLVIIDDTYNASPTSMRAAIDFTLDAKPDRDSIVVLGAMAELDETTSIADHERIGAYCGKRGLKKLYCVSSGDDERSTAHAAAYARGAISGGLSANNVECVATHEAAVHAIRSALRSVQNCRVLVKGSRSARMEQVVRGLTKS